MMPWKGWKQRDRRALLWHRTSVWRLMLGALLHYGVFSHQSCLVWLKWTLVRFPCEYRTFAIGQQLSLDVDQNSMTRTSLKRFAHCWSKPPPPQPAAQYYYNYIIIIVVCALYVLPSPLEPTQGSTPSLHMLDIWPEWLPQLWITRNPPKNKLPILRKTTWFVTNKWATALTWLFVDRFFFTWTFWRCEIKPRKQEWHRFCQIPKWFGLEQTTPIMSFRSPCSHQLVMEGVTQPPSLSVSADCSCWISLFLGASVFNHW